MRAAAHDGDHQNVRYKVRFRQCFNKYTFRQADPPKTISRPFQIHLYNTVKRSANACTTLAPEDWPLKLRGTKYCFEHKNRRTHADRRTDQNKLVDSFKY